MAEDPRIEKYLQALEAIKDTNFSMNIPVSEDGLAKLGSAIADLRRHLAENMELERTLTEVAQKISEGLLLDDVLEMLPRIALEGREVCYNLGGGRNLRHADLLAPILDITGARLNVREGAPRIAAPVVDIGRVRDEFSFLPAQVLPRIPELVRQYRKLNHAQN